ncbi:MAG: carboxypeptidase-like regulatory domain-containing protein [Paludibacteraceae bacterium]
MHTRNRYYPTKDAKKLFVFFALFFVGIPSVAENIAICQQQDSLYHSYTGVVIDKSTGDKLPFAHLVVVSTNISTVTNSEGKFLLKIPVALSDVYIKVSFIGYESQRVSIKSFATRGNKITLRQLGFVLPEISVLPSDPAELIKKMLDARKTVYSDEDMQMTGFYREIIRKKNTPVSISESIVDIYKESYGSTRQDKVSLFKSRKNTNYEKLDTVVFKLMGGPFNSLFVDVVKYPEYFLNYNNLTDYVFQYQGNERIDDRLIHIVGFKQNTNIKDPLLLGKLFIDAQSFALVKADFDLNLSNPEMAAMLFIRKKPFNARIFATKAHYQIDYRLTKGKWRYAYSRINLEVKIDWKKRLFNTYYNTSIEMVATDWKENIDKKGFKDRILIRPDIVMRDAVSGFNDADFWGINNIIEPEKSIENAVNKIQKQLQKQSTK